MMFVDLKDNLNMRKSQLVIKLIKYKTVKVRNSAHPTMA